MRMDRQRVRCLTVRFLRASRRDVLPTAANSFPRMNDTLATDLIYVFAFCLGGLAFAFGPFVIVYFLAPRWTRNTVQKTGQAIECGMDPIGDAWIRYCAVYYLYALVFVAFAVDVLYLIPVALVYGRKFAIRDFVELTLFIGILSLVVVYAWKKGVFEWKRR
jgi:NADH:ubiquinone oxidoreductase subunit 3 (subunit A)